MICKQCGAQIEDNSTECQFCGLTYDENIVNENDSFESSQEEFVENPSNEDEVLGISSDETDIDELIDENEAKRQQQVERLNAEKHNQIKEIEKRRKAKKFKQKRNKALVALLVVAIVAALGSGGYLLWKKSKEEPPILITTQTPTRTPIATPKVTVEPTQTAETEGASETPETEQPSIRPVTPEPVNGVTNPQTESSVSGTQSTSQGNESVQNVSQQTQKPNIRPIETKRPVNSTQPVGTSQPVATPASTSDDKTTGTVVTTAKPTQSVVTNTQSSSGGVTPSVSDVSFGGKEYTAEGGFANGEFTAALVTGIEVISNNNKSYLSFKFNGATYYANISADTSTQFVSGRPMTINAYKTSESYNGSPVYEITVLTNYVGKGILPNSGFELLTEKDLAGLSNEELRLARNEIYARHGRSFKNAELRKYFEGCSWYKVKQNYNYDNDSANLNSIERANIDFILNHEK